MTPIPFIIQGKNIVIVIENKPYTVTESHINYVNLKAAIINKEWDLVPSLVTPIKAMQKYVEGYFECIDGIIFENGIQIRSALADRIMNMYSEGFSIEPMLLFYANIKSNPSVESANELYMFLEHNSLAITDDGCFVAYKLVNENYTDCHTSSINNSVGQTVSMDRKDVESDRDLTCASGLHFCSHDYLKSFRGNRLMVLKIDPKHVVSIPSDYNNSKGRCSQYEVIGEIENEFKGEDTLSTTPVYRYKYEPLKSEKIEESNDNKDDSELEFDTVFNLGLRQQAKIYTFLTNIPLKKFSYRADVERRLYNSSEFTALQIVIAARMLGLV